MIHASACDICRAPLGSEPTRFEVVRGAVSFLPRDRWTVRRSPSGLRVRMICAGCESYLRAALTYLRASLLAPAEDAPAEDAPAQDATAKAVESPGEQAEHVEQRERRAAS